MRPYPWLFIPLILVGLSWGQPQTQEPDFAYFIEPQTQESPQSFRVYFTPEMGASSLDLDVGLNLAVVFPQGTLIRAQSFRLSDLKGDNAMQGQSLSVGYSLETAWGWVNYDVGGLWAKTQHNDFTHDPISRHGFGVDAHLEVVKAFRFAGIGLALDWRYMPNTFNLTSASLLLPMGRLVSSH
jgi:hypothetical protein